MNLLTPWTPIIWLALTALILPHVAQRLVPWARTAVGAVGVAGAAAFTIALRLALTSAPVGFPWPSAVGRGPSLAADAEMFPFAALIVLLLAGVVVDTGAWPRWPRAFALAAASLLSIYAENLLALALAWIPLEGLLVAQRVGAASEEDEASIGKAAAFWGFVGLAAIAWAWHETHGASLRPYELGGWTSRARVLLLGAALIRMSAFPLVSRRLIGVMSGSSPVDAPALSPLVAGLALAQRAARLGTLVQPSLVLGLGAVGALACGLCAWLTANPRLRVAWALGVPVSIALMMWAEGGTCPPLVFGAAAASVALGFGLWTVRRPFAELPLPRWRHTLALILAVAPVAVVCMGPLSPSTAPILRLWQSLLSRSGLIALVLALTGQMFAMAALLRPGVAPVATRGNVRAGLFVLWGVGALAMALWPRGLLLLADYAPASARDALSPGAWAALLLPLLGAIALLEPHDLGDTWQEYGSKALRIVNLGWLRSALMGAGSGVGAAARGLETLLHGENHVLWAVALLLALILTLGFL